MASLDPDQYPVSGIRIPDSEEIDDAQKVKKNLKFQVEKSIDHFSNSLVHEGLPS